MSYPIQPLQQDIDSLYQYRFQYSLASYCHSKEDTPFYNQNSDSNNQSLLESQDMQSVTYDQERILRRSNELITFGCFLNPQTQSIVKTILTHYIGLYTPLAMHLLRISQLIFPNLNLSASSFISKCQQSLDTEREHLVNSVKQLTKIFHNEKQAYLKLIALIVASAVFKILTLQDQYYEIEFETVFHSVYWQLTGSHSTSQLLKKILTQTFNPTHFHHYLMNEQPPKIYELKRQIAQSVSFVSTQQNEKFYDCYRMKSSLNNKPIKNNQDLFLERIKQNNMKYKQNDTISKQNILKCSFNENNSHSKFANLIASKKIKNNYQQNSTLSFSKCTTETNQTKFNKNRKHIPENPKIDQKQNIFNRLNSSKTTHYQNINKKILTNASNPISKVKNPIKKPQQINIQQNFDHQGRNYEQQKLISNQKDFNFKKNRNLFFQDFQKTKSNNKKPFMEFLASNKKPTFNNFLQQKKLHFQS